MDLDVNSRVIGFLKGEDEPELSLYEEEDAGISVDKLLAKTERRQVELKKGTETSSNSDNYENKRLEFSRYRFGCIRARLQQSRDARRRFEKTLTIFPTNPIS